MIEQNKYPKIPLAQSLIEICKAKGLKHIVISPGSRNAPLTIGFVNNSFFKCYSIVDERCAAFFALGMAQQLKEPVAVVCTSGSAVLNYYPAVAEAFYSQIPLVIISADRPQEKIDIGDGQTIRQENVFANHILNSANLTELASRDNDVAIQYALHLAKNKKGPVHINIPFEEPLYGIISEVSVNPEWVDFDEEDENFVLGQEYIQKWNTSEKKLILIGESKPNAIEQSVLESLANDSSVIVMTEKTSNLHHERFISNIDTIITPFSEEEFEYFKPDILLTFGGMVVSKRIKAFLRKYKPNEHWHVDELRAYDTYGCLTKHFKTDIEGFLKQITVKRNSLEGFYQAKMSQIVKDRMAKSEIYLKDIPFSDFKAFEIITKKLPKDIQLQVSNSSAIRYLQLLNVDRSVTVYCNRGTSGIDGSTSTAIGAALASEKQTILITGDVSFFYDSNALWNQYIPNNFKIILINNSGGGIFRILPGHQEENTFNTFFETSHNLKANHLAKMFNFNYEIADNSIDLEIKLETFLKLDNRPSLLEISTPEKLNDKILLEYFKKLK
ncbi:2-succinyl-5-enolpyruvyl-6-hydroxy-3-cyclohexene-1-carboxylic-acid synthase [Flavobacterium sediminilitoris]|uniref:2-succinyl-5-enolpyruvyl-6-hydroxy-3-cyclohexene-1-carboxylate synthase n=1 Tax=Flavobacterium sediminilitoris TaxID=2024526 RepID=A0ABY4HQZ6_9FLAO|nr:MULTISPECIES: 2-succinyl-5-enolpyruvyl-6-hydroxy-3-cyclohexene-1-carboxylic-acid synthase [Flavobacterium]UOX34189.1 2-succinyl-5-enolpyruvyl-6-hydroxy-3-cyclohexene-1-carboxylic-acid synthase [Flavobacterium sediminilitoris]